mgnify:CR=1 FL=1
MYYKENLDYFEEEDLSNPLSLKTNLTSLTTLADYSYSQILKKQKFDKDLAAILHRVEKLRKALPQKLEMPYCFTTSDVNGERVFDENNKLCLIKEYCSDFVREYYPAADNENVIYKILERNKQTGEIISKIDRSLKNDESIKTTVIVFDENINNKYIMFQVEEDSMISSITDIYNNGREFQTLFINPITLLAEQYIESMETSNKGFVIINCKLKSDTEVENIKINTEEKDIFIEYNNNQKIIEVRRKIENI